MDPTLFEKFAQLIVRIGLNIQKDQILVITSPVECASFARIVTKAAFEEGARDVVMNWEDELLEKLRYREAPSDIFDEFPEWKKEFFGFYVHKGAAFLTIYASNPELLKDVDPERISRYNKAAAIGLQEYRDSTSNVRNSWSVASVPTEAWARKVFPELPGDEAMEQLWNAISTCVRLDAEDAITAWENHKNILKRNTDFLNKNRFKFLRYKNALGTDLTIELHEKHVWNGGAAYTTEGVEIIPNMPTEEIFTLPKKTGANGTVVGSMPIVRDGSIIEKFYITFEDGKVVDYNAEKGFEVLKGLIEVDDGSCYLGEVALVPYSSAVSQTNLLYWNTLFDENSSCHLALGRAYPTCIDNGVNMSKEELENQEVNISIIHQDFMIGTQDLEIIGITERGVEISLMKDGNFVF